jgi:hypothetical protein
VFPSRISNLVRNVVSNNDRTLGGANRGVFVNDPSFAESKPSIAASLSSIEFLLDDPTDLKSTGYDISGILEQLRDEPVIVTKSQTVRQNIVFR